MILAVDAGNTRIKAAVFEDNTLLESYIFPNATLKNSIQNILNKYKNISNLVIASVSLVEKQAFTVFGEEIKINFITHNNTLPIINRYETPQTLGIDRIVLATGAALEYPNQNRLVIDAGTCVTYDFIDKNNNYLGGSISPGLRLRYESLHNYTAKLPLLTIENPKHFIGKSTSGAIHAGVVNGLALEIDGYINEIKNQYSNFTIILTGGDGVFLAKRLKNTIFANSNFLLESLNRIFQYQTKND